MGPSVRGGLAGRPAHTCWGRRPTRRSMPTPPRTLASDGRGVLGANIRHLHAKRVTARRGEYVQLDHIAVAVVDVSARQPLV